MKRYKRPMALDLEAQLATGGPVPLACTGGGANLTGGCSSGGGNGTGGCTGGTVNGFGDCIGGGYAGPGGDCNSGGLNV